MKLNVIITTSGNDLESPYEIEVDSIHDIKKTAYDLAIREMYKEWDKYPTEEIYFFNNDYPGIIEGFFSVSLPSIVDKKELESFLNGISMRELLGILPYDEDCSIERW